jgi:hypothetical protein
MNDRSPTELKLNTQGQSFIAENKVIAAFGNLANNRHTLRTEFVSGPLCKHGVRVNIGESTTFNTALTVETSSGRCAAAPESKISTVVIQ